jgi:hypothetical protein
MSGKKQRTQRSGMSRGFITLPGSMIASGVGSNSRMGTFGVMGLFSIRMGELYLT